MVEPTFETAGAAALVNRLAKTEQHLARWRRRTGISCYRLYDADLPEYAAALDVYGGSLHVQEYAPPPEIDPELSAARVRDLGRAACSVLGIAPENVHVKVRRRQKEGSQYEPIDATGRAFEVSEPPCRFLVNLTDHLDSGLFLDHRDIRALLRESAAGKTFLNLFCYTATATAHAIAGGAARSLSVDLSRTYLDWAGRNLALNGADPALHRLERADAAAWLAETRGERFDLVFLDPPTFSRSKAMRHDFDVQRDHVALIANAARLLAPGGTLIFSNNLRTFRMDRDALAHLDVRDISRSTLPPDFRRDPKIHNCWRIAARG